MIFLDFWWCSAAIVALHRGCFPCETGAVRWHFRRPKKSSEPRPLRLVHPLANPQQMTLNRRVPGSSPGAPVFANRPIPVERQWCISAGIASLFHKVLCAELSENHFPIRTRKVVTTIDDAAHEPSCHHGRLNYFRTAMLTGCLHVVDPFRGLRNSLPQNKFDL